MARSRPSVHHSPGAWAAIAGAGAAGSLLRYAATADGGWAGVVLANALGCAVLGALLARGRATPSAAIGFCGGLTTFSGVAAQAMFAAQGHGVGALSAGGDVAAGLLPGAAALLALNALAGFVAFRLARGLGGAVEDPAGGARAGGKPTGATPTSATPTSATPTGGAPTSATPTGGAPR